MSVINQMLRDLDRQQAQPLRLPGQAVPAVPEAGGGWAGKLAALGLLAGGIALAIWLRPEPPVANPPAPLAAQAVMPQSKPSSEPQAAIPAKVDPVEHAPPASLPASTPSARAEAPQAEAPPGEAPALASPSEPAPEPETEAAAEPEPQWHKAAAPVPAPDPAAQAVALLQAGRAAEAEAQLTAALAASPGSAELRLLLARALMAQGRHAQALGLLAEREALDRRNYQAVMAALEQQQGLHGAAERRYTELSRRHPEDASYWLGLGLALDGLSRRAEARAAYARALTLNSLSEPARAHAAARLAAGD
ncbi:MAG: tetratricopeptide repeat protein [Gammaproteobacteria bacterium]|nr:tetratricopeptide repeat protein [Gammaproteobacteria bacterium]